jgi:acetyl-CoA synthetase
VVVVDDLPKTRSGKIMRRLLQDAATGAGLGDTTSLQDDAVLHAIVADLHGEGGPEPLTDTN